MKKSSDKSSFSKTKAFWEEKVQTNSTETVTKKRSDSGASVTSETLEQTSSSASAVDDLRALVANFTFKSLESDKLESRNNVAALDLQPGLTMRRATAEALSMLKDDANFDTLARSSDAVRQRPSAEELFTPLSQSKKTNATEETEVPLSRSRSRTATHYRANAEVNGDSPLKLASSPVLPNTVPSVSKRKGFAEGRRNSCSDIWKKRVMPSANLEGGARQPGSILSSSHRGQDKQENGKSRKR